MADDLFTSQDWIKRAESNLAIATAFDVNNMPENIFLEDLCFELQQCTEKSIKAVLVKLGIDFPRIHDIERLLKIISNKTTIKITDNIKKASRLNQYAVKTRYPHWNKISKEEYKEVLQITKDVFDWAKGIINS